MAGLLSPPNGLAGDIALGGKLPRYVDPNDERNFKREMFERAKDAKREEEAYKDYQVDWSNVDPLDVPKMKETLNKFTSESIGKYKQDKRFLNSPEYMISANGLAATKNMLTANKNEFANYRKIALEHPDAVRPVNQELHNAIISGDAATYRRIVGDKLDFHAAENLRPNVDVSKLTDDALKRTERPATYNDPATGKPKTRNIGNEVEYTKYPQWDATEVAITTKQQWDNSAALQAMFPNPLDYTHQVWQVAQAKSRLGTPELRAAYHAPQGSVDKKAQPSLADFLSSGKAQLNQSEVIPTKPKGVRDENGEIKVEYQGKGQTNYPLYYQNKVSGFTTIANNGKVVDKETNNYIPENTQFKFIPGPTVLMKDKKTHKLVPMVIGTEIDRPASKNAAGVLTEHPITRAINVPLELVDGFLREQGQPVEPFYEAAKILNEGGTLPGQAKQSPPKSPQPPTINSDAEFNALPSGTIFFDSEGKQHKKK